MENARVELCLLRDGKRCRAVVMEMVRTKQSRCVRARIPQQSAQKKMKHSQIWPNHDVMVRGSYVEIWPGYGYSSILDQVHNHRIRNIKIVHCTNQRGGNKPLFEGAAHQDSLSVFPPCNRHQCLADVTEVSVALPVWKWWPSPPPSLFAAVCQRSNCWTIQDFHLHSDKGYLGNLVPAISHYGGSYEAEIKFFFQ